MDKPANLITKLSTILGEVGRIEKKGNNTFHNYKYVMEADLVESVRGKLSAVHIFITASALRAETVEVQKTNAKTGEIMISRVPLLFVEYTFHDGDSQETLTVLGVGEIDQDGGKGIYKAQTGAMKYMLMKNFLIATGDDPEQDNRKAPNAAQPAPAKPAGPRGYEAARDRKFPATAPQVSCIQNHWSELTGAEQEEMREIMTRNAIKREGITKMQASFVIDEMVRIKKARATKAPGSTQPAPGPQGSQPPAGAAPAGTGAQPGPYDMTDAQVDAAERNIRVAVGLPTLEAYMEDLRARPKTKAQTDRLEAAFAARKDQLLAPQMP